MLKVVSIDNMDQVMRKLTKIGKGNGQEVIVEARKGLKKVVQGIVPAFKSATPVSKANLISDYTAGSLRDSIKVKSSTKRGVTSVSVVWDQAEGNSYGSYVNFRKDSPHYRKISNLYKAYKWRMDQASREAIKQALRIVFEREGFTVK